jgi:ribosomal protein S18 acetylase RimI-like enzyme
VPKDKTVSPAHPEERAGRSKQPKRVSKGKRSSTASISVLSSSEAEAVILELMAMLEDAVEDGASIGFIHPMAPGEALGYWRSVLPAIEDGSSVLLVARVNGDLLGSVQLHLEPRANGRHRGEISKLIVLRSARRQGFARALMIAAEEEARGLGRTTLLLDTREGDPSEALYRSLGWQLAGVIPRYARSSTGELDASAFYYKLLTPPLSKR